MSARENRDMQAAARTVIIAPSAIRVANPGIVDLDQPLFAARLRTIETRVPRIDVLLTQVEKRFMRLSRKSRFLTALVALFSVLFTQLAVAAYVCPSGQIAQAFDAVAAAHAAAGHQNMSDCDEASMDQPVLCKAQTQVGSQSLDKPQLPDISPFLAVTLVASVMQEDHRLLSVPPQFSGLLLTRTTAPPLAIQNCCFRI